MPPLPKPAIEVGSLVSVDHRDYAHYAYRVVEYVGSGSPRKKAQRSVILKFASFDGPADEAEIEDAEVPERLLRLLEPPPPPPPTQKPRVMSTAVLNTLQVGYTRLVGAVMFAIAAIMLCRAEINMSQDGIDFASIGVAGTCCSLPTATGHCTLARKGLWCSMWFYFLQPEAVPRHSSRRHRHEARAANRTHTWNTSPGTRACCIRI